KNTPDIIEDDIVEFESAHGTKIKLYIEAKITGGKQSVEEYLYQTSIANPHVTLSYTDPSGNTTTYERITKTLPKETCEIKPHPYGVELGVLMKMLQGTGSKKILGFLMNDFSRVGRTTAKTILEKAGISSDAWTKRILREEAENLYQAINETKIMAPPTDCINPIGEEEMLKSLKKLIAADLYATAVRKPSVYRGNPFQIEIGLAYGGDLPTDGLVQIYRFANRVPLLYQKSACCITQSVQDMSWRSYGLSQSKGALPGGPMIIIVHMASVWVPFTSESKEAIASYPEIEKEIKLAAQECGRQLQVHLKRKSKAMEAEKKRSYMKKYIKHIGLALQEILDLKDAKVSRINKSLHKILERSTK
ncbi:DNA topoisomerase VI subunit B, partial [Elusimicrobiota bacterium]